MSKQVASLDPVTFVQFETTALTALKAVRMHGSCTALYESLLIKGGVSVARDICTVTGSGVVVSAKSVVSLQGCEFLPNSTMQLASDDAGSIARLMESNEEVISEPCTTPSVSKELTSNDTANTTHSYALSSYH